MNNKLLEYLCCTDCKGIFKLVDKELYCSKCNKKYLVIDNIPVILNGEIFLKTKKNWENWWKKIREKSDIDLYDELWREAEKNLKGEALYKKEMFEGKIVLDAGCGNGRYIKSDFSKYNCKEIIGVDIGKQVFEVNNNINNIHYIQSDINNLPFKKEFFDVITCHGVLHHTPNPKESFIKLAEHLKIGGIMAIYVYHKEWEYFKTHKKSLLLDVIYSSGVMIWQGIRKIISRTPHSVIKCFAYLMALKSTIENILEKNNLTKLISKIIKLIPPFAYIGVNFHERVVRNYDHYSATYNYFQSIEEVVDWFKCAGFNNLEITSIPVSIRGIKTNIINEPLEIKQYELINHFDFRREWDRLYNKVKK